MNVLLLPGLLTLLSLLVITPVATVFARRLLKTDVLRRHHDVSGPVYATIGLIYAVLLGFVVVVVWQAFSAADANLEKEASTLTDIYRDAQDLPDPFRSELRRSLYLYARSVVDTEMDSLAAGRPSSQTERALDHVWKVYGGFEPTNSHDQAWYQEILGRLNTVASLRQLRLHAARTGLPVVLWVGLWIGSLFTIGFSLFFGVEDGRMHFTLMLGQAGMIATVILVLWALELPYGGVVKISPQPYTDAISAMHRLDHDGP